MLHFLQQWRGKRGFVSEVLYKLQQLGPWMKGAMLLTFVRERKSAIVGELVCYLNERNVIPLFVGKVPNNLNERNVSALLGEIYALLG